MSDIAPSTYESSMKEELEKFVKMSKTVDQIEKECKESANESDQLIQRCQDFEKKLQALQDSINTNRFQMNK